MTCGHLGCSEPISCKGKCKLHYMKEYYAKNADRLRRQERERKKKNPEYYKAWWAKNTHKHAEYSRKYRTTLEPSEVQALRTFQGGKCAICTESFVPESQRALTMCADHCHATLQPRGLLCSRCNMSLGHYERNRHRFGEFERYLANPPVKQAGLRVEVDDG